ncbi:MAG: hypothetical protein MJK04_26365 [Psychrosphaera sp.]|nr:hypothetical protein [Psychrosphaera sp.]
MKKSNITVWILAFGLFFSITAASTLASVCYVGDYQPPQACNGVLNKIHGVDQALKPTQDSNSVINVGVNAVLMPSVDSAIATAPPPDPISLLLALSLPITVDAIKLS